MKKKMLVFAVISAMLLSGCGNRAEIEQLRKDVDELKAQLSTPTPTPAQKQSNSNEALTDKDVADVKELKWTEEFLNCTQYHNDLLITNKFEGTLKFTVQTLFYDANNNVIGKHTGYSNPIRSGQTGFVNIYLTDAEFSRAEYTLTPSKSSTNAIDTGKMACEMSQAGNDTKYVVKVTNNDSVNYEFAGANIIFYNGAEIKKIVDVYTQDANNILSAGATEYGDFSYSDIYTNYEIYPFGRCK